MGGDYFKYSIYFFGTQCGLWISVLDSTFGVPVFLHFGFGISGFACFSSVRHVHVSLGQSVGFEANIISNFAQEFYCEQRREIKLYFTVHFTG